MKCPNANCGRKIQVSDSREKNDGRMVKRRRRCHACCETWTTQEIIYSDSTNRHTPAIGHESNLRESYNEILRHLAILAKSINIFER